MQIKMHLRVRVPNEGARRLAWWLGERGDAGRRRLEGLAGIDANAVDRLLSGELLPGAEAGFRISNATDGDVMLVDWRHRPRGGWFDRPQDRVVQRRVA